MKIKVSSSLTLIFQLATLAQFSTLFFLIVSSLFIGDLSFILISLFVFLLGLFVSKRMGVAKLKIVHKENNSLVVGSRNSLKIIPFSKIKKIEKTFLFSDFPLRVIYSNLKENEKLYFLPKGNFFFQENKIINELKKDILKAHKELG